jgi:hypothetical protein
VIALEVNLEIHLNIDGTGMFSRGSFKVKTNNDISQVAYAYIKSVKHETGYRPMRIEKVILNGTEDITASVIEIDNQPVPDIDDIFW